MERKGPKGSKRRIQKGKEVMIRRDARQTGRGKRTKERERRTSTRSGGGGEKATSKKKKMN